MIESYSVSNYKIHKNPYQFEFRNINILTGTNNSGKSSLVQSIRTLWMWGSLQSVYNYLPIELTDSECKVQDIMNKQVSRSDRIKYDFSLPIDFDQGNVLYITLYFSSANEIGISGNKKTDVAMMEECVLEYGKKHYQFELDIDSDTQTNIYSVYEISDNRREKCPFKVQLSGTSFSIVHVDLYGEKFDEVNSLLTVLQKYFNQKDLIYLGPYRLARDPNKKPIGIGLNEDGSNAAEILYSVQDEVIYDGRRTVAKAFQDWTFRIMKEDIQPRIDGDEYRFVNIEEGIEFSLNQIGFGNTQLLPIIVAVLLAQKGDTIIIENPEVHLHPRWKTDLVDLFYEAASYGVQFIIETQSLEIVNRVRRRSKENVEYRDNSKIWFFQKNGFECNITELQITEDGGLSCWPEDFVDGVTMEDSYNLM